MTKWEIIFLIIAINSVGSIIYFVFAAIKKSKDMMLKTVVMFLLPPIGVLYFVCQYLLLKIFLRGSEGEKELSYLTSARKGKHEGLEKVDIDGETHYFSLEDAFTVSNDTNKRKQRLHELKKGYITDADTLLNLIRSGTLAPSEIQAYRTLFIDIMKTKEDDTDFLTERDYYNVVNQAILCEDYATASSWALLSEKRLQNELSHFNLLKVNYYTAGEEIGTSYD